MSLSKSKLFFNTIKNLQPIQVRFRLWYLFRSKLKIKPLLIKEGQQNPVYKGIESRTDFICCTQFTHTEIANMRFRFLNETVSFTGAVDWQVSEKGRLWRYNLHYFQYLLVQGGLDVSCGVSFIRDWIKRNPIGTPDAWDPFPISLRLVNWIKFMAGTSVSGDDQEAIAASMVLQACWLMKHLEYHLLGNHLFKNGKALVFMGVNFDGPEAEKWLQKGIEIIDKELDEQILGDGGHFERSPMYHSMILEDCLDLVNILGDGELRNKLLKKAGQMVSFLEAICHPDGQISLFNDAAIGIDPPPAELFAYYTRLTGKEVRPGKENFCALTESGYFVFSHNQQNKMIIDCGPVGPDYQPGHSHCDTLSFELSVKGKRVIVDSGCCQYVDGDIRQYNRGNVGHNTVTIDNMNQSEVWAAHRCGRKAQPIDVEWGEGDGRLFFYGGHDGYKRLSGKPLHFRKVEQGGEGWLITDTVQGQGVYDIESRLHVHPDMDVVLNGTESVIYLKGEVLLTVLAASEKDIEIEKGWYCPEFGIQAVCEVLVLRASKAVLPFKCGWRLLLEQ